MNDIVVQDIIPKMIKTSKTLNDFQVQFQNLKEVRNEIYDSENLIVSDIKKYITLIERLDIGSIDNNLFKSLNSKEIIDIRNLIGLMLEMSLFDNTAFSKKNIEFMSIFLFITSDDILKIKEFINKLRHREILFVFSFENYMIFDIEYFKLLSNNANVYNLFDVLKKLEYNNFTSTHLPYLHKLSEEEGIVNFLTTLQELFNYSFDIKDTDKILKLSKNEVAIDLVDLSQTFKI